MQTALLAVSALLWVTAGFCLPSVIRGRRRTLFWFLTAFATTMSLQPHVIYNAVDALLGGVNVPYFIFHATAIVAITLLAALVGEAVSGERLTERRKQVSAAAAAAIIAVQAILFFGSDWHLVREIHKSFPTRWDFAAYSATTWIAMALFSISVGYACLSDLRRQRRTVTRVSLAFVAFGCWWVLVYALLSMFDAAELILLKETAFQVWSRPVYHLALLTAPISLAVGLGLTATADAIQSARKSVRHRELLWRITPLWERLLADSPELSIERRLTWPMLLIVRDPRAHLYRRYVEVRDSLLLNPGQAVSPAERALIEDIERHVRATATRRPVNHPEVLEGSGRS
ncbi:hypothetical protein E3T24_11470 [Cryobacterium sp. TmT2-59]|uniref:DUF6545 domain-containing protein n=1 Tax=Cryobacterium sp. TmT2-59 TaxID=1259264 RepID=UPI00106C1333|nr:DUF6545 domain-containing protein [Cryobacterium sp. TmT2-59]TFC83613.1 hypothetical protein E3T24_11470 [Cryobacterium sp. TmT2-59]